MDIMDVEKGYYDKAINFLNNVTNIYDVDEVIVENACVVAEDGEVMGVLSFEKFSHIGLIRYFVFKKVVEENIINNLLAEVAKKAIAKDIDMFITLVNREEVVFLFKSLGFRECDKEKFFIEEVNVLNTKFRDSFILQLDIKKYLDNAENNKNENYILTAEDE